VKRIALVCALLTGMVFAPAALATNTPGPTTVPGNPVCPTGTTSVKFESPHAGVNTLSGITMTVSGDLTTVSGFDLPGDNLFSVQVIVKGGPNANIYSFPGGVNKVTGVALVSPTNNGGNIPQISHVTFCLPPGATTPPPGCGEGGNPPCPPPPCGGQGNPCPPPPGCGDKDHPCPPPQCPAGSTPTQDSHGVWFCLVTQVVVVPGPTQVVTVPCPQCCPPGKPKPKCPKVSKSKIKVSFTPKHLKAGNLHIRVRVPKSWNVKKVTLRICTPRSGIGKAKSCKPSSKTFVKKFVIKVRGGRGHMVLPLWRTDAWGKWLWGNHLMQFEIGLKCGIKVVVKKNYFNLDPPAS
jgi:hypothetical protein